MRVIARWFLFAAVITACTARIARAEGELPPDVIVTINKAVVEALAATGAPSASIAVIKDGKIAYRHAYGMARVKPTAPASSVMRYRIGSISKQFVAAGILLLAEDQKLSLDDKVERWLPDLTRAGEVTVRQLLSMTAGYQDYWPQDYMMPAMLQPVSPQEILKQWAHKPLDFEPGTKWQYSNTNYVIAGLIIEKAAGVPLFEFLQKRIFKPLEMTTVIDASHGELPAPATTGYLRYALGPVRPAPLEGAGWLFAAGDLAMTAGDLALWDLCVMNQQLFKPESYRAMQTDVQLANGVGTGYGLGVCVQMSADRRIIWHDGLVSGYTAQNYIYPDDRAAIVVLTNLDSAGASERIAARIADFILPDNDPGADKADSQAKQIFEGLQHGKIDRKLFTDNANAYFSQQALQDFAASLGPLGAPVDFAPSPRSLRGGMVLRRYRARLTQKSVDISTFTTSDGKLEQYLVTPVEGCVTLPAEGP